MSNGQAEIERLEAATSAFEAIITTEEDSVEVPNVGPTPSLKKRVEEGLDERVPGPHVYMQSTNSDVDKYGYPLRTLYKNGDGMIVYYPEYSVFRKDGGSWKRIDPHVRNVVSFNGSTQYVTVPRVNEIDLDNPDLEFEMEFHTDRLGESSSSVVFQQGNSFNESEIVVYYYNSPTIGLALYLSLGGSSVQVKVDTSDNAKFNIKFSRGSAPSGGDVYFYKNDDLILTTTIQIGIKRVPDSDAFIGCDNNNGSPRLFLKAIPYHMRIWTGGDRNTGQLTRDYRMDEGWNPKSTVLINYATDLGEERIVNGTFDSDLSEWTITGGNEDSYVEWDSGAAHMNSIGAASLLLQQYNLSPDTNYIWKASFDVNSGSLVWGQEVAGTLFNVGISSSGDYERVAPSISNRVSFKRSTSGTDILIDNVSVRQADGYGTYVGFTEASWTEETV